MGFSNIVCMFSFCFFSDWFRASILLASDSVALSLRSKSVMLGFSVGVLSNVGVLSRLCLCC